MTRLLLCVLCCMLFAGVASADISFSATGVASPMYQANTFSPAGQSGTLSSSSLRVVAVPEPAAITLLTLQLLAVGALLRRKFFAV